MTKSQQKKLGRVLFVTDERLSREKSALLTRRISLLKQHADVVVLPFSTTEDQALTLLREQSVNLILAPWYRYLSWSRVEAFYGLTRTNGPTFAGYFCDPLLPFEAGESADHLRAILVDLSSTHVADGVKVICSLIQDKHRTGLSPLLEGGSALYYENWYPAQGLGLRIDAVMNLPEVALGPFSARGNAIRICLTALWSLVYDTGPGKGDFSRSVATSMPKAYFQVGADRRMLLLRLIYSACGLSPKEVLASFWPKGRKNASSEQLLQRYADLLRVHWIAESGDLELTVGFNASHEADPSIENLHSLWIEPISTHVISEIPFEVAGPTAPRLKPLPYPVQPQAPQTGNAPRPSKPAAAAQADSQSERLMIEAATKIRDLKRQVSERDERLRELRAGGVGTAPPLPPPNMDTLIEALRARINENSQDLARLTGAIAQAEKAPDAASRERELARLRAEMTALEDRQKAWIAKMSEAIELLRRLHALRQARGA